MFFDGVQAPVVYASAGQVSAIVPYGVSNITAVAVEYQLRASSPVTIPVAAAAPGIFAHAGTAAAIAVNQNGAMNSSAAPAARAEIVTLFATGEGETADGGVTGRLPEPGKWPAPAGKVEVTVGGVPAELAFVGQVAAGLLQLKLRIPSAAPEGGGVPVTLTVSGVQARTVTVALK